MTLTTAMIDVEAEKEDAWNWIENDGRRCVVSNSNASKNMPVHLDEWYH